MKLKTYCCERTWVAAVQDRQALCLPHLLRFLWDVGVKAATSETLELPALRFRVAGRWR